MATNACQKSHCCEYEASHRHLYVEASIRLRRDIRLRVETIRERVKPASLGGGRQTPQPCLLWNEECSQTV